MADEPPISVVPLSSGIRKSQRDSDPFAAEVGEALTANCGVYTQEGGFRQHGGITVYTASAANGAITWLKRWYKPDGTKYFLALSQGGTLYRLSDSQPSTLTSIFTGLSGTPFSSAEINGWLYLSNGIDPFLRYDGIQIQTVGADPPDVSGMIATENVGAGTLAAGTYKFKLTYEYGTEGVLGESNASSGAVTITVSANATISLSNIPVPTRTDVTFKNIYRTLVDEDIYFWIARIPASQTTYTVDVPDTDLSSANFQLEEDHDIPPRLKHIVAHLGRIFGEDPAVPGRIRFSLVPGSDVFPNNPIFFSDELGQDGEQVTATFRLGEGLYASKKSKLWVLTGDTNSNFIWYETINGLGFMGPQSVARGSGVVYGLGQRDILVFDGVQTLSLEKIRGLLDNVDPHLKPTAVGVYRDKKYYLAVQTGADTRRAFVLVVHADPTPGGGPFEASTIEVNYTTGGAPTKFQVSAFGVWENENDRVFVGGYDGFVYEFDIGILWNRVGEEQATADFSWRSNWIWGQGPAQFERYEKVYVMVESEGGTLTFGWEIMDDDPNVLFSGTETIDLNPIVDDSDPDLRIGRWDVSRWG